jgi:CxxC motif-containing protein (DUF1111 family)
MKMRDRLEFSGQHGGEAATVRRKYDSLNREQKDKLLAFLTSLRAPTIEDF